MFPVSRVGESNNYKREESRNRFLFLRETVPASYKGEVHGSVLGFPKAVVTIVLTSHVAWVADTARSKAFAPWRHNFDNVNKFTISETTHCNLSSPVQFYGGHHLRKRDFQSRF